MELDGLLDGVRGLLLLLVCFGSVMFCVKLLVARIGPGMSRRGPAAPVPQGVEPPAIFGKLKALGFTVVAEKEYSAFPGGGGEGYVIRYAPESVYPCRACGQRGKHAFGETAGMDECRSGTVWLGHVCGRCGHFERYPNGVGGGGFFGVVLDDAACLSDLIDALESHGPRPLLAKMEQVLAEREAVLHAKAQAVGMLRCAVSERLGGASVTPFRSLQGATKFLA